MKIYKSEINDGLGDLLKNNSIACCAVAEKHNTDVSSEDVSKLRKILAEKAVDSDVAIAQNEDQIDLGHGRNDLKGFSRPQKGTHWTTVQNSEKIRFRTIEIYDKKSNIISKNRTFHK